MIGTGSGGTEVKTSRWDMKLKRVGNFRSFDLKVNPDAFGGRPANPTWRYRYCLVVGRAFEPFCFAG